MLKNRPQLSRNMDKNNALAVFAGLLALSVVAAVLYPLVPQLVFNSWIALQILIHVLRFFGGFQLVASSHDMEKYRRSVNQFTAILVISGMLWGLTGFMAARWGNNLHHLLILAVVTGLVGGSISTISPIFKAFMGFIIPAFVLQSLSFYFSSNVAVMGREPFYEVFISLLILLYMIVI